MFYDNYIRLCAQKKKSPSAVAKEIGLSNAAANGWKRGKYPNDTTLAKLSSYFGVPASELTGEAKKESSPQSGEPLHTIQDWEKALDGLDQEQLKQVMDLVMKKFMEGGK